VNIVPLFLALFIQLAFKRSIEFFIELYLVDTSDNLIFSSLIKRFFTYRKRRGLMTNSIKPTVAEIVCDYILDNQAVVDTVDSSMPLDKLNIDSLEKNSLIMDLGEHFDIDISDLQIEAFVTIADIIDHIELMLAAQPSIEELAEIQRADLAEFESEAMDS